MSKLGVAGLRAERDTTLTIAKSLSEDEWNAPSDCDGWAVRDVVAHMASILHGVVDPSMMPDMSGGTEDAMEGPVAERRAWPIEDVLAEYETYSGQVADLAASLQDPPMSDTLLPMGDLGTHKMAIMPSTFLFDNYCHLRNDILKPNGPIARSQPPRDEQRLAPTIEWMLAGLPWMCADKLAFVDRPVTLVLTGAAGGTWSIGPGGEDGRVLVSEGAAPGSVATISSDTHDFVVWGTQRRPWKSLTSIDGDAAYAARVLDAFKVIYALVVSFGTPRSPAPTSNEAELLLGFIRWQREQAVATTYGLTEQQLRWTPDGRLMPIIGVINHLARMEWRWVEGRYLGSEFPERGDDFAVGTDTTGAEIIDAYWQQAQRTEKIVRAAPDLDAVCLGEEGGTGPAHVLLGFDHPITLRWVLLHLIEETAHHAGHADATREMLDGTKMRG